MFYQLAQSLVYAQLLGFSFWSIAYFFFSANHAIKQIDSIVSFMARIAGIFFLLNICIYVLGAYFSGDENEWNTVLNRAFGPYFFIFWIQLLTPLFISQLLWHRKSRLARWPRLVSAIFLLISATMSEILVLSSLINNDFVPFSWAIFFSTIQPQVTLLLDFVLLNGVVCLILIKMGKLTNDL